jgi:hypothetical protein
MPAFHWFGDERGFTVSDETRGHSEKRAGALRFKRDPLGNLIYGVCSTLDGILSTYQAKGVQEGPQG